MKRIKTMRSKMKKWTLVLKLINTNRTWMMKKTKKIKWTWNMKSTKWKMTNAKMISKRKIWRELITKLWLRWWWWRWPPRDWTGVVQSTATLIWKNYEWWRSRWANLRWEWRTNSFNLGGIRRCYCSTLRLNEDVIF